MPISIILFLLLFIIYTKVLFKSVSDSDSVLYDLLSIGSKDIQDSYLNAERFLNKVKKIIDNEYEQEDDDSMLNEPEKHSHSLKDMNDIAKKLKKNKTRFIYLIIFLFISIVSLEISFFVQSIMLKNHKESLKSFINVYNATNIIAINQRAVIAGTKLINF